MRVLGFLLLLLLLTVLVVPAEASPCQRTYATNYVAPYVAPVAVVQIVQPITFFQFVAVPTEQPAVALAPAGHDPAPAAAAVPCPKACADDDWPAVPHVVSSMVPVTAEPAPSDYQIAALAQTHCASCHTAPRARGDVVLFNARGQYDPQVSATAIYAAITRTNRPMPLGNNLLSARDKDLFRRHAKAARPVVARRK